VVLDSTIVNIALPSAQHDLGFANSDRQWIVTAYALAFGSLLLLSGRIGDIFGRKWTFISGLIGFAVASAIGGAATDFATLAGARALQGVFGALLAPSALSLLATTFTDPAERRKAFAIFGAIAGGGGAVGLLLGGILTSSLSWRYCLYVNLIFAVVAVIGGLALLTNPPRGRRQRLDIPGTVLASAGLFGVVFGFSEAQTDGWSSPVTLIALFGGLALLVAFVQVQRRVKNPLLPLRVVLDRNRGGAYLAVGLTAIAIFGVFLFLTYFLQTIVGYTPVRTGVAFLPLPAMIVLASTMSNIVLLPRIGPRRLIVFGLLLGFVGLALLTRLDPTSSYPAHVLPSLIIMGLGFGCIFGPAFSTATSGVAFADAGVASAMVNTMQQVGGSVGTALLSTVAAQATSRYLTAHATGQPSAVVVNDASVHGYTTAFAVSAGIFLVAAVVCGLLIRNKLPAAVGPGESTAPTAPTAPAAAADGAPVPADQTSVNQSGPAVGAARPAAPADYVPRHRRQPVAGSDHAGARHAGPVADASEVPVTGVPVTGDDVSEELVSSGSGPSQS
jgi:EmrB/QacA subfamily drug resistance transporter